MNKYILNGTEFNNICDVEKEINSMSIINIAITIKSNKNPSLKKLLFNEFNRRMNIYSGIYTGSSR
ncbi:MAG: hypothetical protein ACI4N3_04730 [Alphaproteobacteria bacterium]